MKDTSAVGDAVSLGALDYYGSLLTSMGEKPKILHSLYWMPLFFLLLWPQPSILGKNSWLKRKSPFLGRFHYIKASLVMQTVKNLPAMLEARVQSLCREDPLEKGMTIHSNILVWRILWIDRGAWGRRGVVYNPWGHKELDTTERLTLSLSLYQI